MKIKPDSGLERILDFLQTVYRFRLDVGLIPSVLAPSFRKAAERFKNPEELKMIDKTKMGICEEVADIAYQVLKMLCLQGKILTGDSIAMLQNYLTKNHYYDASGALVGLDYLGLDGLAEKLVPEELAGRLQSLLPAVIFHTGRDNGYAIIRDFLAGQFVAYISRIWRGHEAGGLQTIEYIRDKKIPEETRELIEALVRSNENLTGDALMAGLAADLGLSRKLLRCVQDARITKEPRELLVLLAEILKLKTAKPITVEDTLNLMFLKMKGRQEMDFIGIDEQTMRRTCKPVEYLIEADMFF